MNYFFPLLFCFLASLSLFSQSNIQQSLSVNSTGAAADASAQLDVSATDKGMLVPRMTSAQRTAIASPAIGLLVFDTTTGGFWFFLGTSWTNLSSGITPGSSIADADGNTKVQTEKFANEDIIRFDLGGSESMVLKKNAAGKTQIALPNNGNNIFVGESAGNGNTTAFSNVAIGKDALLSNTVRPNLVAVGDSALFNNGLGVTLSFHATGNTAVGSKALFANTTGYENTATGWDALRKNTTGDDNTANGWRALFNNTTGYYNTATGGRALISNTTGVSNTATGQAALLDNTTGNFNTAIGGRALSDNTTGDSNTAIGHDALWLNTTGFSNTANGREALFLNTTGDYNTALGYRADVASDNLINATAIGARSQVAASNSLVLGSINGVNGATSTVNVGIGTTTPAVKLHIEGGTDLSPAGGGYLQLGPATSTNIILDNNEIMARNNGVAADLILNFDGGSVGIGRIPNTNTLEVNGAASKSGAGDWLANSDARLKNNIQPLNSHEMLEKLLALQGVTYEWNDDQTGSKRPDGIQYGFTAQNIREVFPTLVEEDKLGYLQTAYGTYDAMTVEAIRALKMENDELKMENAAIKTQLSVQSAQLDKITAALAGMGVELR